MLLSMSSCSSVDRALTQCLGSHEFDLYWRLRFFFFVPHSCHIDQFTFSTICKCWWNQIILSVKITKFHLQPDKLEHVFSIQKQRKPLWMLASHDALAQTHPPLFSLQIFLKDMNTWFTIIIKLIFNFISLALSK